MKHARCVRCVVLAVGLSVAGCSDPEAVRVLDEPKPTMPGAPAIPPEQKQFRTLAAMVPADGHASENAPHWWFFKMSGKSDVVAKYEADFDKLIESVRAQPTETDPITWKLPDGWTWQKDDGGASRMGMRYATLKSADGQAEVAVSQAGGLVFMNVQRWWTQLWGRDRAGDVTAGNVFDYARQRTINGRIVITVDMSGPKDPNAKDPHMGGPMMNPHNPHGDK